MKKKKSGWILVLLVFVGIVIIVTNTKSSSKNKSLVSSQSNVSVATEKPTAKPTATPKPVSVYNGEILRKPDYEGVCEFTVKASPFSNHYIYLQYKSAPGKSTLERKKLASASAPYEQDIAFYVGAGKEATVSVPIGIYKLYYASGDTYYGEKLLFGNLTGYYSSDDTLDFYADNKYTYGHTVTLTPVTDGNFDTDPISSFQFPGR